MNKHKTTYLFIFLIVLLSLASGFTANLALEDNSKFESAISDKQTVVKPESETTEIPKALSVVLANTLGRDNEAYQIKKNRIREYTANTPSKGFSAVFDEDGIRVESNGNKEADHSLSMVFNGVGYGDNIKPVKQAEIEVTGNRIEYSRDEVVEWYVNSPMGLEQGFTLKSRPNRGNISEPLRIEIGVKKIGGISPVVVKRGEGIEWRNSKGKKVYGYSGLYAYDARGRELESRMELGDGRIILEVDDRGVEYPIVVDPFIEVAKLTASDGADGDRFGESVSINGSKAIVGSFFANIDSNSNQGAAYIFEK